MTNKIKLLAVFTLVLILAGCLLGDDIETIRSKAGEIKVPGTTLAEKLSWLKSNAGSGGNYIVEVNGNNNYSDFQSLSYGDNRNITITLRGVGAAPSVYVNFTVSSGVTLVLDGNIKLLHHLSTDPIVYVRKGGTFIMNGGTIGSDNNWVAVTIEEGGTFTKNGGTINGTVTRN